jgi:glycosyltransferase involved in cell wall biosynthesis
MLPKVSCIMPTCYGDQFVQSATECFLDQDYEGEMELIVVDNNDDSYKPTGGLVDDRIKVIRTTRKPVGALRNEGIKAASGEVIVIFDEDDWHAPDRIATQVDRLIQSEKAVTGWHSVFYYDVLGGGTYRYNCHVGDVGRYAVGASQCFWKTWWEKHPYVEQGVEDRIFSDEAMHLGQLDSCDAGQLYVARIHDNNVIRKNDYLGRHKQWPSVPRSEFPKEFFGAKSFGIEEK